MWGNGLYDPLLLGGPKDCRAKDKNHKCSTIVQIGYTDPAVRGAQKHLRAEDKMTSGLQVGSLAT